MTAASGIPPTAKVAPEDIDFRVIAASRDDLVALQRDAELREWGTRWSSAEALLCEVGPSLVYICPFLRERRNGILRSYRCFVIHSLSELGIGAVSTIDVAPERLEELPNLDLDAATREAFWTLFAFASNGIGLRSKG